MIDKYYDHKNKYFYRRCHLNVQRESSGFQFAPDLLFLSKDISWVLQRKREGGLAYFVALMEKNPKYRVSLIEHPHEKTTSFVTNETSTKVMDVLHH